MYRKINVYQFINAFKEFNRSSNFSNNALKAMFDHFEEEEESQGVECNLDVIAICCDYVEYRDLDEVMFDYDCVESMDDLYNYTTVIEFDGGLVIQAF